jgi:hypothetical protein
MINTLWIFAKKNVWGHRRIILQTTHPYLSGIVAFLLTFHSALTIKPYALAGFFLPYDTVVFGFTATAIALAIAIPSRYFILFLSENKENSTAFRDFIFVLVWNGSVHILSFFMFLPFIFMGDSWTLQSSQEVGISRVYVFVMLWLQFYSCIQFFVTTIAVFQLADLYAQFAAKRKRDNPNNSTNSDF